MPQKYELLDHTADVAIRVQGADWGQLLASIAWAVVDLMASAHLVAPRAERALTVEAASAEELIVAWANEILYRFETERLLLPHVEIEAASPTKVRARARGETLEPTRHQWKGELKSATYHDLVLRRADDGAGFSVDLVLDV
ncbi:MAG TPA: archease [Polyangia bacterium]|nr:archease [Polyangia bacterium]